MSPLRSELDEKDESLAELAIFIRKLSVAMLLSETFIDTLDEACTKTGWLVHAGENEK